MYEFPPSLWIDKPWWPLLLHVGTMVITLALFAWLIRRNRRAKYYDGLLVLIISFAAVIGLWLPMDHHAVEPKTAHSAVFVLLGAAAFGTIWHCWRKLQQQGKLGPYWEFTSAGVSLHLFFFIVIPLASCGGQEFPRRQQCKYNLKNLGLVLHTYHDIFQSFPANRSGQPEHTWRVDLLGYLDYPEMYNEYDFDSQWNVGVNDEIARRDLYFYRCPSVGSQTDQGEYPITGYAALIGKETIWPDRVAIPVQDISDGHSNTLLVVEACGRQIPWCEPKDVAIEELEAGINLPGDQVGQSDGWMSSYHGGGVQVLLGDGRVQFLSNNTDKKVLRALATRSGGESVPEF